MSMNIFIEATRQVQVIKTGQITEQSIKWPAWQTPTSVTHDILNSADPADSYKAWVLTACEDYTVAVFAEDDIWEDGEPIGTKVVSPSKEHVAEFDDWLKMCEAEGYEVKFHMI